MNASPAFYLSLGFVLGSKILEYPHGISFYNLRSCLQLNSDTLFQMNLGEFIEKIDCNVCLPPGTSFGCFHVTILEVLIYFLLTLCPSPHDSDLRWIPLSVSWYATDK